MSKETYSVPWKKFAERWQKYYRPPGRPSREAIKNYRIYLKQAIKGLKRNPKVLIFGSTPELRDLCYEEKCDTTFADINLEMILAMSELTKHKNEEEIILRGNWLDLPLAENYYDVAMGDIVLSNVPWEKRRCFLQQIQKILKVKGYFITKTSIVPKNIILGDYEDILNKFINVPMNFYKDRASASFEFFVYLYNLTFNRKEHIFDLSLIKSGLSKYFKKDKFIHPNKKLNLFLNDTWLMWGPLEKTWSGCFEHEIREELNRYFKILNKQILSDCYFKCNDESFPIWLLQVKK